MGLLPKALERWLPSLRTEQRATVNITSHDDWMKFVNLGGVGKAVVVNEDTAASINAVFACVDAIVRTKSLIRPDIFRYELGSKYKDNEHDQWWLLNVEANSYTTAIEWEAAWITNYYIYGKGYARIVRNGRTGRPKEYINLEPWQVEEVWNDGERVYKYTDPDTQELAVIKSRDMLHLSGFSHNNKKVYSRATMNRTVLQDYLNMQTYGTEMYTNGTQMTGLLISEGAMDIQALELLRASIERKYSQKSGQLGALPRGVKYQELRHMMPMADANLIEAKKLSIEDIARAYGVPLTVIGRGESADNKGDNEFNMFLSTTIAALCLKIENEFKRKIFRSSERDYYVKYDYTGLIRTDYKTKMEGLGKAVENGILNRDEARSVLGLSPIPNGLGKVFSAPMNFMPLDQFINYNPTSNNNGTP